MMDGGYMLPEFGVAYVKNVRFFHDKLKQERIADLILSACTYLNLFGFDNHLFSFS